ncbi:hypothetical protein ACIBG8_44760 [Nonomuraea sp. NPDC050556]|uniref:hypothetical protein n=1 Tax=Nonomuraea sp. NPDC050556 TaxID=3364369 RepID=UPI0037922D40
MNKRRMAALTAVAGILLMSGLTGSAMADNAPDQAPKGTCTTSDGKTFEFKEAMPALTLEPAEKADPEAGKMIKVEKLDDSTEATATTESVPAESAKPADDETAKLHIQPKDGAAITVTCKLN